MKIKSKKNSSTRGLARVETSRGQATDGQIRQRAYEIFVARGAAHGQDVEDWVRAESELQASRNDRDQAPARSTAAIGGQSYGAYRHS
jgi:hypothetical protein